MTDRNDKTTVLPQYSFDITLREGGGRIILFYAQELNQGGLTVLSV